MKISLERLIKFTSKSRFNFEGKKTKLAVRRKKKDMEREDENRSSRRTV